MQRLNNKSKQYLRSKLWGFNEMKIIKNLKIFKYATKKIFQRLSLSQLINNMKIFLSVFQHHADLRYADLSHADLTETDLVYADLIGANLSSVDFRSANLKYADLRSADLNSANLVGTDLSYADLRCANLSSADISFTNLFGADLTCADLRNAKLSSDSLHFTKLFNTDLTQAELSPINGEKVIIEDFMSVQGLGSFNRPTLIFKTNIGIVVQCGCFYGTEKQFRKRVKETHGDNNYAKEYLEMLKLAKIRFSRGENVK